jgi:hypothetical protein
MSARLAVLNAYAPAAGGASSSVATTMLFGAIGCGLFALALPLVAGTGRSVAPLGWFVLVVPLLAGVARGVGASVAWLRANAGCGMRGGHIDSPPPTFCRSALCGSLARWTGLGSHSATDRDRSVRWHLALESFPSYSPPWVMRGGSLRVASGRRGGECGFQCGHTDSALSLVRLSADGKIKLAAAFDARCDD